MHAADQTGPGSNAGAGSGSGSSETVRYIITRPCLAEGSLRLLKYLQPLFPADGPVTFQDHRGEVFGGQVDAAQGRLTGLGELYRAHNLGVNDVLLISRDNRNEGEEGRYRVECVVKPHARPQSPAERPAPPPLMTEKRVVIHATPHVREVRTERVTEPSSTPPKAAAVQPAAAQPPEAPRAEAAAPEGQTKALPGEAAGRESASTAARVNPVRTAPKGQEPGAGRSAAPLTAITARMQQAPARLTPPPLGTPIQMNFTAAPTGKPASQTQTAQVQALQAKALPSVVSPAVSPGLAQPGSVQPRPTQPRSVQAKAGPVAQPETAPVAVLDVTGPKTGSRATPVARATQPHPPEPQTPGPQAQSPEDQLTALARLTGYACEHLGDGVVRLRAELGTHGYSVLIATTKQALTTPAWRESCDYMALLTPEDERPQGIPRFTHSALSALVAHAAMTPLTPIDLRGYWNTGSFDQESAESIGELVSAHLAQRRSFSHVLETLAQQPAHSLVNLPRLAERLGSEVSTPELQSILETLSRAPFLALTPLPNGQYYLRSEIDDLVQEFGTYAQSLQRRLRLLGLTAQA